MSIQFDLPEARFAVAGVPLHQYDDVIACLREVKGFVSMTCDNREITLIVAAEAWEQIASRFPEAEVEVNRRMIRFDTVLDFSVVGFIAEISRALADADISILSISTYSTDSVLVHEARIDDAVTAVKQALGALSYTRLAQH